MPWPNTQLLFALTLVPTVGEWACLKIRTTLAHTNALWQYLGICLTSSIEWAKRLLPSFCLENISVVDCSWNEASENTWGLYLQDLWDSADTSHHCYCFLNITHSWAHDRHFWLCFSGFLPQKAASLICPAISVLLLLSHGQLLGDLYFSLSQRFFFISGQSLPCPG